MNDNTLTQFYLCGLYTRIVRTLRTDYRNHKHIIDTTFIGKSPTFIT